MTVNAVVKSERPGVLDTGTQSLPRSDACTRLTEWFKAWIIPAEQARSLQAERNPTPIPVREHKQRVEHKERPRESRTESMVEQDPRRAEIIRKLTRGETVTLTADDMLHLAIRNDKLADHPDLRNMVFRWSLSDENYEERNYQVSREDIRWTPSERERFFSHIRFSIKRLPSDFFASTPKLAGGYPVRSTSLSKGQRVTLLHGTPSRCILKIVRDEILYPLGRLPPELSPDVTRYHTQSRIQKALAGTSGDDHYEVEVHFNGDWNDRTNWFSPGWNDTRYQKEIVIVWDLNVEKLQKLERESASKIALFAQTSNTYGSSFFMVQPLPLSMARAIVVRDACEKADGLAARIQEAVAKTDTLRHIQVLRVA